MSNISSYPSVYALGHKLIKEIFSGEVLIEEKVDGSQFSFGVINGELFCRSKGKELIIDAPEKMFSKAVEVVKLKQELLLPNKVYRAEYLKNPKHNVLKYGRTPKDHLIIFDIGDEGQNFLSYKDKKAECDRLGFEVVPMIYQGEVKSIEFFNELLENESCLGEVKIEGVVVKNYNVFTLDKKIAIGKYVSEAFKEVHGKEWKKSNPGKMELMDYLISKYKSEARWSKAVQHLRDNGQLSHTPKDIALLVKEIPEDIKKECEDEIKQYLFNHYWPLISRSVMSGMPEWYKQELLKSAF